MRAWETAACRELLHEEKSIFPHSCRLHSMRNGARFLPFPLFPALQGNTLHVIRRGVPAHLAIFMSPSLFTIYISQSAATRLYDVIAHFQAGRLHEPRLKPPQMHFFHLEILPF